MGTERCTSSSVGLHPSRSARSPSACGDRRRASVRSKGKSKDPAYRTRRCSRYSTAARIWPASQVVQSSLSGSPGTPVPRPTATSLTTRCCEPWCSHRARNRCVRATEGSSFVQRVDQLCAIVTLGQFDQAPTRMRPPTKHNAIACGHIASVCRLTGYAETIDTETINVNSAAAENGPPEPLVRARPWGGAWDRGPDQRRRRPLSPGSCGRRCCSAP